MGVSEQNDEAVKTKREEKYRNNGENWVIMSFIFCSMTSISVIKSEAGGEMGRTCNTHGRR